VPLAELPGDDTGADGRRKLQETQRVGYRRPVFAEAGRERLLRVAVLSREPVERLGELHRVQVLALHVLDEGELERGLRRDVFDDDEHLAQARALRRTPSALARDDLELVLTGQAADDDRLEQPVLADGSG